jgi:SpoVK/Ycf46/Vps4 family AAA+-type ATPase
MASSDPLRDLFAAVASRRWDVALSAAKVIASKEDGKGRHAFARDLYRALEAHDQSALPLLAQSGALTPLPSDIRLADVVLPQRTRSELEQLLEESRHTSRLASHGVRPRKKLLFYGPPGCGKSLTARALGRELDLPVALVRFEQLIGSWLGQTGQRLQEVFAFARTVPSVVVLDEVDALSRSRGRSNDVGEMDRALISLLQNLEHDEPAGLLVASTNVPEQLDAAMWRRFDLAIEFPKPTREQLKSFAKKNGRVRGLKLNGEVVKASARWNSYADAVSFVDGVIRRRVLARE